MTPCTQSDSADAAFACGTADTGVARAFDDDAPLAAAPADGRAAPGSGRCSAAAPGGSSAATPQLVPASAASWPPAEPPQITARCLSMPYSAACVRSQR